MLPSLLSGPSLTSVSPESLLHCWVFLNFPPLPTGSSAGHFSRGPYPSLTVSSLPGLPSPVITPRPVSPPPTKRPITLLNPKKPHFTLQCVPKLIFALSQTIRNLPPRPAGNLLSEIPLSLLPSGRERMRGNPRRTVYARNPLVVRPT